MTTNVLGPSKVVDGDDIDGRGRDGVKRLSAMFPRSPSIQSVKSLLGSLGARSKSTLLQAVYYYYTHTSHHTYNLVTASMCTTLLHMPCMPTACISKLCTYLCVSSGYLYMLK